MYRYFSSLHKWGQTSKWQSIASMPIVLPSARKPLQVLGAVARQNSPTSLRAAHKPGVFESLVYLTAT